jgi:hypothetical protein
MGEDEHKAVAVAGQLNFTLHAHIVPFLAVIQGVCSSSVSHVLTHAQRAAKAHASTSLLQIRSPPDITPNLP